MSFVVQTETLSVCFEKWLKPPPPLLPTPLLLPGTLGNCLIHFLTRKQQLHGPLNKGFYREVVNAHGIRLPVPFSSIKPIHKADGCAAEVTSLDLFITDHFSVKKPLALPSALIFHRSITCYIAGVMTKIFVSL